MKNLNNYITEKLHINKNTKIVNSNIEKIVSMLDEYLSEKLHYINNQDYILSAEEEDKYFTYICVDWKTDCFDNFSFKQLYKSILNKIEDIVNKFSLKLDAWFDFKDKNRKMTFRISEQA